MSVSHASYAKLLSKIASRGGSRAVFVSLAHVGGGRGNGGRKSTMPVSIAESVGELSTTPLFNGAISLGKTLDAATSFELTLRSTRVRAISILGTEIDANTGERIAVGVSLGGARRTVLRNRTSSTRGVDTAISAATIKIAVEGGKTSAVIVGGTINASSSGNVALGLVRFETTITNAIRVLGTSLASLVSHAVVPSTRVGSATVVIGRGGGRITLERREANTIVTDNISTHRRRSIVGHAIGGGGARSATAVLHAVLVGRAVRIVSERASIDAEFRNSVANSLTVVVSIPSIPSLAICVCVAIEAKTICHAVSTLSSNTKGIVGACANALTRGSFAVRLIRYRTTIRTRASSRTFGNNTRQAGA